MIADADSLRRQIRASADEAVAEFIESLEPDVGGTPSPPKIEVDEVASQSVEFDFIPFGEQGATTTPSGRSPFIIPVP